MSNWNSSGWNNPYGYPNSGGAGFGGAGFGSPRGPHPSMGGMYNMWGPYGGNQMGMVSNLITLRYRFRVHHFISVVLFKRIPFRK